MEGFFIKSGVIRTFRPMRDFGAMASCANAKDLCQFEFSYVGGSCLSIERQMEISQPEA